MDELKDEILRNQNENQSKTDASIFDMTRNLSQITNGLSELITEVTVAVTRLKAVEERGIDTAKRVDDMELSTCSSVEESLAPRPFPSKLPTYASVARHDLLEEAEEKRCRFFFGPVKDANNRPTKPAVSSLEIIRPFFSTVSLENIGPHDATYRRVSVDRLHYSRLKAKAPEHSADMKELGKHPQLRQYFWDIDGTSHVMVPNLLRSSSSHTLAKTVTWLNNLPPEPMTLGANVINNRLNTYGPRE